MSFFFCIVVDDDDDVVVAVITVIAVVVSCFSGACVRVCIFTGDFFFLP